MSFWNKPVTDRQWNAFWARVFGTLYLAAIVYTMLQPRWHLICVALMAGGLTWLLTASHFYHRSRRDYLCHGQWWTPDQMQRLRDGDPDMQRRAVDGEE
jgi:hypothetical protein